MDIYVECATKSWYKSVFTALYTSPKLYGQTPCEMGHYGFVYKILFFSPQFGDLMFRKLIIVTFHYIKQLFYASIVFSWLIIRDKPHTMS